MAASEPQRRIRLLVRLRLHCEALRLPESALEVDPGLCPGHLHVPHALGESRDESIAVDTEGGERPESTAGAETDLESPKAHLVQGRNALGHVQWARHSTHEHRTAEPDPLSARGRVRQDRARIEVRCGADDLLC